MNRRLMMLSIHIISSAFRCKYNVNICFNKKNVFADYISAIDTSALFILFRFKENQKNTYIRNKHTSRMFKPITIKDIAQALGLSASTVSRALSDSHEINEETKRRVLEYAN